MISIQRIFLPPQLFYLYYVLFANDTEQVNYYIIHEYDKYLTNVWDENVAFFTEGEKIVNYQN